MDYIELNVEIKKNYENYDKEHNVYVPLKWKTDLEEKINQYRGRKSERCIDFFKLLKCNSTIRENAVLKNSNGMKFKFSPYASSNVAKSYTYRYEGDVAHFSIKNGKVILESISREDVRNKKPLIVEGTIEQQLDFFKNFCINNL